MESQQPAHRVVACVLVAIAAALAVVAAGGPARAAAESAPGPAGWMFDPGSVAEIDLGGLSAEEIDALEAEPDEYQRGTFELKVGGVAQGQPLGDVGIRLKGTGSFRKLSEKAAFKIKFNEYVSQTFFGLKKLTLNNLVQDPSMLHETLAYELFRALGVAASRTGFAFVRLNDEDFGLYLNIETLDKIFLPRWFGSTRHLYEADKPGLDLAIGSGGEFEVDEGNGDIADLESLIVAANAEEGDWSDGMSALADLAQMTRMWAVERYIGHWDGYAGVEAQFRPNNYYLHDEDTGVDAGRFQMLPWGTDQTWELFLEFDEPAGGLLFNRCLADESCEELYIHALRELQKTVAGLDLDGQATAFAGLLAPWQELETEQRREYSAVEIEEGVEAAREFIAERPGELAAWLGPEETEEAGLAVDLPTSSGAAGKLSPAPPLPTPPLRLVGNPALAGGVLRTRLRLPDAGEVRQRVTIETAEGAVTVCSTQASLEQAGTLTLRCRLSAAARRHLRARWLKLNVAIRFEPEGGEGEALSRKVVVPRAAPLPRE